LLKSRLFFNPALAVIVPLRYDSTPWIDIMLNGEIAPPQAPFLPNSRSNVKGRTHSAQRGGYSRCRHPADNLAF